MEELLTQIKNNQQAEIQRLIQHNVDVRALLLEMAKDVRALLLEMTQGQTLTNALLTEILADLRNEDQDHGDHDEEEDQDTFALIEQEAP